MAKRFITPFAEAGDRAEMPDTPAGSDSNYQTGYPSEYEEDPVVNPTTAKFVERDKSNQLYNDITANIKEWQEHTYPEFITSANNSGVPFAYKKNSIVTYLGIDYASSVDANTDTPPSIKWEVYSTSLINNLSQSINFATIASYKAFTKSLPTTKRVYILERDAFFSVISGVITGNTSNIAASDEVDQSIKLITNGIKNSKQWGAIGDFNPATNTGTDDTVVMQSMYDSLEDGDQIVHIGRITLDRDNASLKTVQGVTSYILVADNVNNLKVTGTGTIYQRYNALDTVGVCFFDCDDLYLDMPIFDGNFRYLPAQPITYKQQLVHIIQGKRHKGGFTVRNCSNIGFMLTNQHGALSGYVESERNDSIYHTIISENCLQNTTFGTGVNRVTIGNFIALNPITAALKLSSRIDIAAPDFAFKGVEINSVQLSFDESYVIPNNEGDTGLNSTVTGIDYVSGARDVHINSANLDFQNVTIASIGVKQAPQDNGDLTRRSGPLRIDYLKIRNQAVVNSTVLSIDNEATGSTFGTIEYENVSKIIEVSDFTAGSVQPRELKYLKVDNIIGDEIDRLALSAVDYTADYIEIGTLKAKYEIGYALQAIRIDSSCDLNRFIINDLDVNSVVTVLGVVNDKIDINGVIDVSGQAADPLNIDMAALGSSLKCDLSNLDIKGDNNAIRKCTVRNVNRISVANDFILSGCPLGVAIVNSNKFFLGDGGNEYLDLTTLTPWVFTGAIPAIQGAFSYSGSPNNVQIADTGCSYRRQDTGQLYMKTSGIGTDLGWNPLT